MLYPHKYIMSILSIELVGLLRNILQNLSVNLLFVLLFFDAPIAMYVCGVCVSVCVSV